MIASIVWFRFQVHELPSTCQVSRKCIALLIFNEVCIRRDLCELGTASYGTIHFTSMAEACTSKHIQGRAAEHKVYRHSKFHSSGPGQVSVFFFNSLGEASIVIQLYLHQRLLSLTSKIEIFDVKER